MKRLHLSAAPPFRTDDPYRDMVRRLTDIGYSGVMMGWSRDWSDAYIKEARGIFENANIAIHEVGAYCNLAHGNPDVRQKNIENIRVAIAVANKLGCSNVASVVGSPAAKDDALWDLSTETYSKRTWKLVRGLLEQVCSFTEGTNVKFLIEPHLLTCMNSPQNIKKMIKEVSHPNLGVVMDIVNLIDLDGYQDTGAFISQCFELLGNHIHLVHAKDIYCDPLNPLITFKEVTPGDGILDYECLIQNVVSLGRGVPLMVEHLAQDQELVKAHDFICKIVDNL